MADVISDTIARVRELSEAATPGPWVGEPDGGPHRGKVEERSDRGIETVAYTYCGAYDGHGARNAELVAYYRTACPQLADECERLRERVAHLEYILATPKTNPLDDPLLTCVICGSENCDAYFQTRGGGEQGTWGIHIACRRAARAGLKDRDG